MPLHRARDRIVGEPRSRGVAAPAVGGESGDDVPRQPAWTSRRSARGGSRAPCRGLRSSRRGARGGGWARQAAPGGRRGGARRRPPPGRARLGRGRARGATASPPFMSLAPRPCTRRPRCGPAGCPAQGRCLSGPQSTSGTPARLPGPKARPRPDPHRRGASEAGPRAGAGGSRARGRLRRMSTSSSVRAARRVGERGSRRGRPRHCPA